jgi:hypothetical protein
MPNHDRRDYTPHQQRIIRNYYRNRDEIQSSRLADLVAEIYLAGPGKKADRLWDRVGDLLARGSAPIREAEGILARRDIEALARLVSREDGAAGQGGGGRR